VSDDGAIDCGHTCNTAYESPTTVTVRAIADPGFRFIGWDGTCGEEDACTVEMTADRLLAATFVRAPVDLAVFRPSTGAWFVDLSGNGLYDGCALDVCKAPFGMTGDLPVVGDWTGSGVSTIGVFRPSNGYWFLDLDGDSRWDGCAIDGCFGPFGQAGDLPIAIDWFGIGIHLLGVFRPSTGIWYIDLNADGRHDGCNTVDGCLGPWGMAGDLPVVGDWDDWGFESIGVFRPSTGVWYLDRNLEGWWEGCQIEHCVGPFGMKGDLPVVGDWNGDGKKSIGIFRPSTGYWYLDENSNRRWDGFAVDSARGPFGGKHDRPVPVPW
ncbi:MAG: InlB B-repeat-containing protein, partial [Candidatus Binatia bacterium]